MTISRYNRMRVRQRKKKTERRGRTRKKRVRQLLLKVEKGHRREQCLLIKAGKLYLQRVEVRYIEERSLR